MGIGGDHGPEGAAVPHMDGWMDGWLDGKTVLNSSAGRIFGAGVNNHNDSPKHKWRTSLKKSQNYLLNFLYLNSII